MITHLTLSQLPPSGNHIYARSRMGGVFKTKAYKTWAETEGWNIKSQKIGHRGWAVPVFISGYCRQPIIGDLDNVIKAMGDLLQNLDILVNDRLVHRWDMRWHKGLPDGVAADLHIIEFAP